jgi:hypothetical protein
MLSGASWRQHCQRASELAFCQRLDGSNASQKACTGALLKTLLLLLKTPPLLLRTPPQVLLQVVATL